MAIDDAYATEAEYTTYLGLKGVKDSIGLARDLKAWSRKLDLHLHRETGFNILSAAEAREYCGEGSAKLRVDNIGSLTDLSIKIDTDMDGSYADETALTSADYKLYPLNSDKEPNPRPWTSIVLMPWGSQGVWPYGQFVQVTAKYGWPGGAPDLIKQLLINTVGTVRHEDPLATGRISEMGQIQDLSPTCRRLLLDAERLYSLEVVAAA